MFKHTKTLGYIAGLLLCTAPATSFAQESDFLAVFNPEPER